MSIKKFFRSDACFALIFLTIWYLLAQLGIIFFVKNTFQQLALGVSHVGPLPWLVKWQLIQFIFIELALHGLFLLFILLMCYGFSNLLAFTEKKSFYFSIFFWILSIITIDLANQYYFPQSKFAFLPASFQSIVLVTLSICLILITIISGAASFYLIKNANKLVLFVFAFFIVSGIIYFQHPHSFTANKSTKPNIIIIGIDSLRPDYTFLNKDHQAYAPHINEFLQNSFYFTNTLTPLARTFPAWTSILTGLYPVEHGGQYNLIPQQFLNLKHTLAKSLQAAGYYTIFSTDDTLFNNITPEYGFNKVLINYPLGASNFVLSIVNDFPLTNLIINTRLGGKLFPFTYGNRAAAVTYQPDSYIHYLQRELNNYSERPLFLAIHLCLVHWPFYFAEAADFHLDLNNSIERQLAYISALSAVDQQFQQLLVTLQQKQLLDNAIVILLSDHGEAFGLSSDSLLNTKKYQGRNAPTRVDYLPLEHGTNIFSKAQYNAVLAIQGFGQFHFPHKINQTPISLLDITPTVLNLIHAPIYLNSGHTIFAKQNSHRSFFLASGISSSALQKPGATTTEIIQQLISLYQVNQQSGQVEVKPNLHTPLLATMQRAIVQDHWELGVMPGQDFNKLILINLKTGQWTDDMNSQLAKHSPANRLMRQLTEHYKHNS